MTIQLYIELHEHAMWVGLCSSKTEPVLHEHKIYAELCPLYIYPVMSIKHRQSYVRTIIASTS